MQNEWYKTLTKVIPLRHSVRTYSPKPLVKEIPEQINHFFDSLLVPFTHDVTLLLFEAEPGKKLYNNGINPVNNATLISQTDLVSISKVGFIGELIMLYAVSLGLDTCWFGHYRLAELGRYIPDIATTNRIKESTMGYGYGNHIDVGERAICCIPIGHKDKNTKRLVDFVAGKNAAKRKPLENLLESPEIALQIPQDIKDVLELAKLAPSAANSQMWRFGLGNDFKTVTVAKPMGYKHFKWEHPDVDIGICAAHIWLGLQGKGYQPEVSVKQDKDRALWTFNFSV